MLMDVDGPLDSDVEDLFHTVFLPLAAQPDHSTP